MILYLLAISKNKIIKNKFFWWTLAEKLNFLKTHAT